MTEVDEPVWPSGCSMSVPPEAPVDIATALLGVRIELLVTFTVLAQELHFTRAASRLFMSQSGVSRRVALLERCLGVTLLERSTRRVELTDAGEDLLTHAQAVLGHLSAASRALAVLPVQPSRAAGSVAAPAPGARPGVGVLGR